MHDADRRAASRPLNPSTCPDCHVIAGAAVLRTERAVYFHCSRCGRLWSIPKPLNGPGGTPDTDY